MQINQKYLVDMERNNNKQLPDWDLKEIGYSFKKVFYSLLRYYILKINFDFNNIESWDSPFELFIDFNVN